MTEQTKKPLDLFFGWIDRVTVFFAQFSALFGIALVFIVVAGAVSRYVFNSPLGWRDEISAYIFIYHCLLALAYATYLESHIAAEMLYVHFPPKVQFVITVFSYILAILCSYIICYYGFMTTYSYLTRGWASDTVYEIILWPIMLMIPLGFLVFGLQCLSRLNAIIVRMRKTGSVVKDTGGLLGLDKK